MQNCQETSSFTSISFRMVYSMSLPSTNSFYIRKHGNLNFWFVLLFRI